MYHKILVAHDGSEGARRAFAAGLEMAGCFGAELHIISVLEVHSRFATTVGEVLEEREEELKHYAEVQAEALRLASARGVILHTKVVTGHEVEAIVNYAREQACDLLVIGFMGHSRLFGNVWGGTSQNLTKLAPCSVLVVK